MPFFPPPHFAKLPFDPPDSVSVHEFLLSDKPGSGRWPIADSLPPFTCGITGKTHSAADVVERVRFLARALARDLGFDVNRGETLDKVIGIYSINTIDTVPVSWAVHRLNGVSAPLSSSASAAELIRHIEAVKCKALFTSVPQLSVALEAAAATGIPTSRVFMMELAPKLMSGGTLPPGLKTVDQLIDEGKQIADELPESQWAPGQGARQPAFLLSSSGTSGLPKIAQLSHRGVIANLLQRRVFESDFLPSTPYASLLCLPLNHCGALIVTALSGVYMGCEQVVFAGFDLDDVLKATQRHRMHLWLLVPSMMVAMIRAASITDKYDLSSVKTCLYGASALTKETYRDFLQLIPDCKLLQAYGMTETSVTVCEQRHQNNIIGSCGHLLPGYEARLVDADGGEITAYNQPGQLLVKSPSLMIGYLNNETADRETFTEDGWLRTGDIMEMRRSAEGMEDLFYIDRLKEMIKVKGMQVSPVEIESLVFRHEFVKDVSVVAIPDDAAGELPIAFIVLSAAGEAEGPVAAAAAVNAHMAEHLADYKRLAGGIEFVEALPKTSSGKTQRGEMKARARAKYEAGKRGGKGVVLQAFEFGSDEELSSDED